ncbi:MAG: hypothetical protein JWN00_1240 [Actinomycetia bacterium]|nr:hypothetical protein [Actinomycetes bacterium]
MNAPRRLLLLCLASLSLGPLAAACGAPQYTYVKNSDSKTYFRIPAQWHRFDDTVLSNVLYGNTDSATAQLERKLVWTVAYDAARTPSIDHLTTPASDDPIIIASVQPLTAADQGKVSLDALRNLGYMVTPDARQAQAQAGTTDTSFEWLKDQVLTPGNGLRGVREIYNASPGGNLLTTDRTVIASDDGHLYLLIIRCSAHCYRTHASELDDIARSFTVRTQ